MHRITVSLVSAFALVSSLVFGEELKFSLAPGFFEENPGGKQLGPCHGGVVIDKAGNMYVTTDTERGIIVFSPDGKYLIFASSYQSKGNYEFNIFRVDWKP